jgi:hypothetical protein
MFLCKFLLCSALMKNGFVIFLGTMLPLAGGEPVPAVAQYFWLGLEDLD